MTRGAASDSPAERALSALALLMFWLSFALLAVGLGMWLASEGGNTAGVLLNAGIIGLFTNPALRLALAIAAAVRLRDWLLLGATLAVLAILLALTVRDAASL